MNRKYWYTKWKKENNYVLENDRLKRKYYIYNPFPKTNMYGFQNGNIRGLIVGDLLARYHRMQDKNVMYPTGLHSLCNSSFVESKRNNMLLNDDISNIYNEQIYELGIGVNEDKHINMRNNEYVSNLQQAFIDLYRLGYIEYKDVKVYYDKEKNKIYDYINKPEKCNKKTYKAFVLKINDVIDKVVEDINKLECDLYIKDKILSGLNPQQILEIPLFVSNGSILKIKTEEPQFLGGVGFILLNPDYIDITDYVDINEYSNVISYLETSLDVGVVYSGLTTINPLTGVEIPIFISTIYKKDIYLGFPSLDEDDMLIAENCELNYHNIIEDDKLINSDFLDGCSISEGKSKIIEAFVSADIASLEIKYLHDEIMLSSLDNFGPLYPFLEHNGKLTDLTGYLPYLISDKFRPVLATNVDIIGNPLSGTINNLFIDGVTPIIALLYDKIGSVTSIVSNEAIDEYLEYNGIDYFFSDYDCINSQVLMPIIIMNIVKKISNKDFKVINRVEIVNKIVDKQGNDIKKINNNLIDFNILLSKFYSDSIRYYYALNECSNKMIFDINLIKRIDSKLKKVVEILLNSNNRKTNINQKFSKLINDVNYYLSQLKYCEYVLCLDKFIDEEILANGISYDNVLTFIKIIYPVCPFLSEEIYKNLFESKYSIINEEWPKNIRM